MVRFAPQLTKKDAPDQARTATPGPGAGVEPAFGDAIDPAPHETPGLPEAEVPDPLEDVDALEELEEEIAVLAAHIHAATHRLLMLIAEFDRRRGWQLGGHRTCAHWLSFRTGIDLGAAREKVRTARVLVVLPGISAAMSRGELSFSKVRALTRVATPENEESLLGFARSSTTAQLERMVRAVRRGSAADEAEWEKECYESRRLSVFPDDDPGMVIVQGRLPAEIGAVLMRAVEAASDALYREERPAWMENFGAPDEVESEKKAAQRRADALGLVAERALAAGFGNGGGPETGGDEHGGGWGAHEHAGPDDLVEPTSPASHPAPVSGTRAERYQVVLHVEPGALTTPGTLTNKGKTLETHGPPDAEGSQAAQRSELEDGMRVSAETSRRISCDAGLVKVVHAANGSILDVGRRTRTIPPALRRALEYRDRGCRFPGCGSRFTDGHHVKHWADGGETKLDNLVLLCRYHHRLVHEEGWKVDWWGEGRPVFFDPRGGTHFDGGWAWPEKGRSRARESSIEGLVVDERARSSSPDAGMQADRSAVGGRDVSAETLFESNRARGVRPHAWTASAKWKREEDIPTEVSSHAWEAMLESRP